ncbi:MAG: RNA methyltransferase [Clostridium sp.]|nr:RNA methyltransferase [Clostridium sp.]MDY3827896.1 RNA methyltransferase [Clostridium sp.]
MIVIESKDNSTFKEVRKLKERKNRKKLSKYIIEGSRLVEEAFKSNTPIESLFFEKDSADKIIEDRFRKYSFDNIKVYYASKEIIKELSSTEEPQGIIAVAKMKRHNFKDDGKFYLLCDKVQDPGNMGTIIRTAHAANVDGIILTKGTVDIYNDKVIRATMGSIFYVPIVIDEEDNSELRRLIDKGFSLVATSLEGNKNFFEEKLTGNIIICVGNEGNGVSDEIYRLADKKVKIPMPGNAESLNVSVAASIIMYEKVRQQMVDF